MLLPQELQIPCRQKPQTIKCQQIRGCDHLQQPLFHYGLLVVLSQQTQKQFRGHYQSQTYKRKQQIYFILLYEWSESYNIFSATSIIILLMCQFLCCECWWCNWCGVCAGYHLAYMCCSCWFCKPYELYAFDPATFHCMACDGCGGNCFCHGSVMCAPLSVINWSKSMSMRNMYPQPPVPVPPASARAFDARYPNRVYIE